MNSLLMDLEYKKIFAIQFAKVTHLCSCVLISATSLHLVGACDDLVGGAYV